MAYGKKIIYANLKLDWFYEFKQYLEKELQFRNIDINDYWFLYGVLRLAQANAEYYPNANSQKQFMLSWTQENISLWLVWHYTLKLALNPLRGFSFIKYVKKGARILEYGCGIAPITNFLIRYFSHKKFTITCADIGTLLFHYARYRLQWCDFIEWVKINDPFDEKPLSGRKFDVIFALATFKHLPKPMAIMKHFYDILDDRGFLIFDYVRSEGKGLDSLAGLIQRDEVIQFVIDNFSIISGHDFLQNSKLTGPIIVQKRR